MKAHAGLKATVIVLGEVSGPATTPKFTLPGVSKFNNFELEDDGLRVWQAYGIGPGAFYDWGQWGKALYKHKLEVVPRSDKPGSPSIVFENAFVDEARETWTQYPWGRLPGIWQYWYPLDTKVSKKDQRREDENAMKHQRKLREDLDKEEAESPGACSADDASEACQRPDSMTMQDELDASRPFFCTEPGCTAAFSSTGRLQRHLDLGKHKLRNEHTSLLDFALGEYVAGIEARGLEPLSEKGEGTLHQSTEHSRAAESAPLEMGWALHRPRPQTRRTKAQKDFLENLFRLGQRDPKRKVDPAKAAKLMREKFAPEHWLRESQIQSVFSSLFSKSKAAAASLDVEEDVMAAADWDPAEERPDDAEVDAKQDLFLEALHEARQEEDSNEN